MMMSARCQHRPTSKQYQDRTEVVVATLVLDHGLALRELGARADLAAADRLDLPGAAAVPRRHHHLGVDEHAGAEPRAFARAVGADDHDRALPLADGGHPAVHDAELGLVQTLAGGGWSGSMQMVQTGAGGRDNDEGGEGKSFCIFYDARGYQGSERSGRPVTGQQ